uniref:Uncharacterized protein n=1 Tax=Anguilla anguilla TaxID=7936 RepID=A0A0E9T444_ANGAN
MNLTKLFKYKIYFDYFII